MGTYLQLTWNDSSNEKTTTIINVDPLATDEEIATLRVAAQALSHCTLHKWAKVEETVVANTYPEFVPLANRETKILVSFEDVITHRQGSFSIGGVKADIMDKIQGTDRFVTTDQPLAAFIDALENTGASPIGNAVGVLQAKLVGRNI